MRFCTGYLTKLKNIKMKAKSRHFRLTESTFAYYEANAGSLIAKVKKTDIIHVEDVVNTKHFRVRTAVGTLAVLLLCACGNCPTLFLVFFFVSVCNKPQ